MKTPTLAIAMAFLPQACAYSATVSAPSTEWTPLQGNFDYLDDLQLGHADSNIVGFGSDYGLFVTHNDNGNASKTDGTFGFRIRLDAPGGSNSTRYTRAAYLGIDANNNDSIDVFIGINFSGSRNELGIYAPGSGANNTPGSTGVASSPVKTYAVDAERYNYRPVDYLSDGGTTNDLNPGGHAEPDYYLSMLVDFEDIVSYLSEKGILINDTSALRFTAATSTQGNTLNGDIAGVRGDANSTSTWSELGVFTQKLTVSGFAPVPEPGSSALMLMGSAAVLCRKRRIS